MAEPKTELACGNCPKWKELAKPAQGFGACTDPQARTTKSASGVQITFMYLTDRQKCLMRQA